MEAITSKLGRTRLFANLPEAGLVDLIERPGVQTGEMLETVPARPGDVVVLLEGGLHMLANDGHGDHLAILSVDADAKEPGILYTIPHGAAVKLTRASHYLIIDGERLDALVAAAQEQRSLASLDDGVRERVAALIRCAPFKQLTFDRIVRCAEAMQRWDAGAGEAIVEEGAPGDYFYVLESGHAEVVRRASGGAREVLAMLRSGSTFGEEALLKDGPRNATVRMTREGTVLRLARSDFDRLLRGELLHEVAAAEAERRSNDGSADLIDCRSEEEWEVWRLPRARLIPLETIRERSRGLDSARRHIVYCRNGRRSAAAAFLLRQKGLNASSLTGGIAAWPYAVEGAPLGD